MAEAAIVPESMAIATRFETRIAQSSKFRGEPLDVRHCTISVFSTSAFPTRMSSQFSFYCHRLVTACPDKTSQAKAGRRTAKLLAVKAWRTMDQVRHACSFKTRRAKTRRRTAKLPPLHAGTAMIKRWQGGRGHKVLLGDYSLSGFPPKQACNKLVTLARRVERGFRGKPWYSCDVHFWTPIISGGSTVASGSASNNPLIRRLRGSIVLAKPSPNLCAGYARFIQSDAIAVAIDNPAWLFDAFAATLFVRAATTVRRIDTSATAPSVPATVGLATDKRRET
jgi:hypothetical protein